MSSILKFDFQKREQLRFSDVNYLNYTQKNPILHVSTTFSLKQGETRTSHGPIPHPLRSFEKDVLILESSKRVSNLRFAQRNNSCCVGFSKFVVSGDLHD